MENSSNALSSIDTITIPVDATAEGLVADAEAEFKQAGIPFTEFSRDAVFLVRQDLPSVLGKTLKIHVHNFGREWGTSEGQDWQKSADVDVDGNAAAYLIWVTKAKPMGWSRTIASDDARLFRFPDGGLGSPYFTRVEGHRVFGLGNILYRCPSDRLLVAFSRNT